MKREVLKIYLIITFFFFFIIAGYFLYEESKNIISGNVVTFSKKSGFYNKTITIKLRKDIDLPIGSKLFYTLDGNDPTIASTPYKNSIKLEASDTPKLYPVKVVAYNKGYYSKIVEQIYIIDKDADNNDMNVISITSDGNNLYNYETGILIGGKTRDDNIKNGKTGFIHGNYNNRGDEWLRDCKITMFDKKGNIIINQDGKFGISGGTSSAMVNKSFKIVYGDTDSHNKKFNLNFNTKKFSNYSNVNEYNSLRLRGGSQDMRNGNIRSSIVSKLVTDSNFDGYSTTDRILVFLNGNFYGVYDIQQTNSKSTMSRKFSLIDSEKINVVKAGEPLSLKKASIYDYLTSDLSEEENREELEKYVDMDNYLLYYAIQILINNTDWPNNNYKLWKYDGEYNESNKYTDGRYRFLIYDTDLVYYGKTWTTFFEGADKDTFESIMNSEYRGSNSSFKNVMQSKYYRDKYIMLTQDLLNTSFKEKNALKIFNDEYKKLKHSYKNYYSKEDYDKWEERIKLLKEEIIKRDDDIQSDLEEYFDLEDTHKVKVKANKGIQINFSNQEIYQNKTYSNDYYTDIDLRYTYKAYPGYKFSYWLVNGEKIYDEELVIDEDYEDEEIINIEAVAEYQEKQNHLIISEVYAKGYSDWIKITNIGKKDVTLKNYYLSDNEKKLSKYELPNIKLKSNESIIINGNKNYYSVGDYISNFSLRTNEKIILSKNNEILDSIIIPKTSSIETYGRYDNSNTYKFFLNTNNERKTNK